MNTFQRLRYGLLLAALIVAKVNFSQDLPLLKDNKCYVVVGAFKLEKNAAAFAESLAGEFKAEHKYNSHRQLHYVFTHHSEDREVAKKELFAIRENHPDMKDSWLYAGNFNGPHITSEQWAAMLAEEDKATDELLGNIVAADESGEEEVEPQAPLELEAFRVYLNTINAKSGREVSGKFKVIDMERNKEHSEVNARELLIVKPKNGTNRLKFVSNIFGFKIDEHLIDLDEPMKDAGSRVGVLGDTILINFELTRYKKGEFAILWKVYFYKDAAIMKEESVYQLNQMLQMMKSDENMRIKIHGHTNGNSKGKVLYLNLDDKEFFSLNGSHNEGVASAKKLSEYRAYTIRHWLMDQGIAEDRMEIIGWGGKKMLFGKHDDQAHQNVRVEIEVLETS